MTEFEGTIINQHAGIHFRIETYFDLFYLHFIFKNQITTPQERI